MIRTAIILLTLAIISGSFALKLQKAYAQEKRYYEAWRDVERLLPPQHASPEFNSAWAQLRLRDKELNVRRGLGRGVTWITLGFTALALIACCTIKTEHPHRPA